MWYMYIKNANGTYDGNEIDLEIPTMQNDDILWNGRMQGNSIIYDKHKKQESNGTVEPQPTKTEVILNLLAQQEKSQGINLESVRKDPCPIPFSQSDLRVNMTPHERADYI